MEATGANMIRKAVWVAVLAAGCGAADRCAVNVVGPVSYSTYACSVGTDTTADFQMSADGFYANIQLRAVAPGTYASSDVGASGLCHVDGFIDGFWQVDASDPATGSYKLTIASVEDRTPPVPPGGFAAPIRIVHGTLECEAGGRLDAAGVAQVHASF
jgi:hypothetical protein